MRTAETDHECPGFKTNYQEKKPNKLPGIQEYAAGQSVCFGGQVLLARGRTGQRFL